MSISSDPIHLGKGSKNEKSPRRPLPPLTEFSTKRAFFCTLPLYHSATYVLDVLILLPQSGAHRITPHRDFHPNPNPSNYSSDKDKDFNRPNMCSSQVVLAKINCPVVLDTLEVVVMHLGRVAEADNRMSVENLGLIFGQVKNDFIPRSKCLL